MQLSLDAVRPLLDFVSHLGDEVRGLDDVLDDRSFQRRERSLSSFRRPSLRTSSSRWSGSRVARPIILRAQVRAATRRARAIAAGSPRVPLGFRRRGLRSRPKASQGREGGAWGKRRSEVECGGELGSRAEVDIVRAYAGRVRLAGDRVGKGDGARRLCPLRVKRTRGSSRGRGGSRRSVAPFRALPSQES